MARTFAELAPKALSNTVAIAERCNVELDFSTPHLPDYHVPEGRTKEEYLKELISGKFIEETLYNNSKSFVLTQKGFDYLNKYQVINDFIDSFGLN